MGLAEDDVDGTVDGSDDDDDGEEAACGADSGFDFFGADGCDGDPACCTDFANAGGGGGGD